MTYIDKIARELCDALNLPTDQEEIVEIKSALRYYGDEMAKQMRHDCAHFAWEMECGGRDIKDVPEAIRAMPLPSEKVTP